MEQETETKKIQTVLKGWTDKSILKQGFYFSLVFQFFLVTLPYIVWKPYFSPGALSGATDMLFVMLVSVVGIPVVAGIGGLYFLIAQKDLTEKSIIKPMQVTGILGNALGFILVLYSIFPGMNYTLNIVIGEDTSIDLDALLPTLLLAGTVISEGLHVMMLVLFLDMKREDFGKACAWGLVFTMIPFTAGFISFTTIIMPGGMFLIFFASVVMFGISAFMLTPSSLKVINRKHSRDLEGLVESSPAVEVTSFNITGYLFLISFLLFHYTIPLFSQDPVIAQHSTFLILLPIVIAGGIVTLGSLSGDSRLHGRLLGGAVINVILVFLTYFLDLQVRFKELVSGIDLDLTYYLGLNAIEWAYIQAIMVGAGIGLVIEPIFRSILKFKFFKYPVNKLSGYTWLTVLLTPFMIGLAAIYSSDKGELQNYEHIVVFVLVLLSFVPLVGVLDYSNRLKFTNKYELKNVIRKVIKIHLLVLLIAGFFMVFFDFLVVELVDGGWEGLLKELRNLL